ncbi:MAG: hypothetical protein Q6370_002185 [Candidatus Sigynarchaeota archaeon]
MTSIRALLEQAATEGAIECPLCGSQLEPDVERCGDCGWINPLEELGLV